LDGHVRALAVEVCVRFVEAEDGVGAVVSDAEVDVYGPYGGEGLSVVVEEGDEAIRGGRIGVGSYVVGGVGKGVVVVGPGDVGRGRGIEVEGCYVAVGEAAFGGIGNWDWV
jgi:hypothetical protein